MKLHFNQQRIIHLVQRLMAERGTLKVKLGEVLGIAAEATSQAKAERANRFLSGKQKSISIDELNALSDFFGIPIIDFLYTSIDDSTLAQTVQPYGSASTELHTTLTKLGLHTEERDSIAHIIQLLAKK